jgi:5-methylcytosine-specific restriction endonuclease McrA
MKSQWTRTRCYACGGRGIVVVDDISETCVICKGKGRLPKADIVEYYDDFILDSAGREHPLPAVIAAKHQIKRAYKKVQFSKRNVMRRDRYTCQYCCTQLPPSQLEMEHVVPKSMWKGPGRCTDWHNIVAACQACNRKKDNRTPEQAKMPLKKRVGDQGGVIEYKHPKQPTYRELVIGVERNIPKEWELYVKTLYGKVAVLKTG